MNETPLQEVMRKACLYAQDYEKFSVSEFLAVNRFGQNSLHCASKLGLLDMLPTRILTLENLSIQDNSGDTPLHLAALNGFFDYAETVRFPEAIKRLKNNRGQTISEISASSLNQNNSHFDFNSLHLSLNFGFRLPEHISAPELVELVPGDTEGKTYLHRIVQEGRLSELRLEHVGTDVLLTQDSKGRTVLELAVVSGQEKHLPIRVRIHDRRCHPGIVQELLWKQDILGMPSELFDVALWMQTRDPKADNGNLFHVSAHSGLLDKIPAFMLVSEALNSRDRNGRSPVHILASCGQKAALLSLFDKISWTFDWQLQDDFGNTVFHEAATTGLLAELPPESLMLSTMSLQRKDMLNPVDLAYRSNYISDVPEQFRHLSIQYSRDLLIKSLEGGDWTDIPNHLMNVEVIEKTIGPLPLSESYLHIAARGGNLHSVPEGLLNDELLRKPDSIKNTPLHLAASVGRLNLVPSKYLDPEILLERNSRNLNVIDLAFDQGEIALIEPALRWLSPRFRKSCLLSVLAKVSSPTEFPFVSTDLLENPSPDSGHATFAHWLAAEGRLTDFSSDVLVETVLANQDACGNTPVHFIISVGNLPKLPTDILSQSLLRIPNNKGVTCFHLGAEMYMMGGIPIALFSREVLVTQDKQWRSVADLVYEHGNTPLLPPEYRNLSKRCALDSLKDSFNTDFISASERYTQEWGNLVTIEQFNLMRMQYVYEWFEHYPDLVLDDEQADAVAECGQHVQVTARAGSGKTRTLVARTLFQIKHCRIHPSSILVLAFNRKAVDEIRERLANYLDEEGMPHVLTFHALAYRIVRPEEELIYDEGETKEGQVFSGTIQRIIDAELRGGPLELELRILMEVGWAADLSRIIEEGYDLTMEEFFVHRYKLPRVTMDGRRVSSEAHKHVGNALLRHRIRYSYRKTLERKVGTSYTPEFFHYNREKDSRIIIEVLDANGTEVNPAREAFWKSEYSKNSRLIQVASHANTEATEISRQVAAGLRENGVPLNPMSDDELWEATKDRAIDDFTKAAKQFVSRCQKELITPKRLSGMVDNVACHCAEVQERFWRLCVKLFSRYLVVLADEKKTDFDQLMRKAADIIEQGQTRFTSSRGSGNLSNIRHVLIDEFQDFSHLFNELRRSFIGQSPDAKFFCVGDDWQAINKFAGSDLRYFTGFQSVFQPSTQKLISRNYRSCARIVEAGNQVMMGEGQPSIPNRPEAGFVGIVQTDDGIRYTEAEEFVVEELGEQAIPILRIASESASRGLEVAVLSRNGSVATPEGMLKLDSWERKLRQFLPEEHRELLKVSTMHRYKGKESDVVILLGPENYPSIHPDAIFNTIFGDTLESNEADEKRLFYVGVTRARSQLFLLSDKENSVSCSSGTFLRLISDRSPYSINKLSARLVCGSRVIVRLANVPGFLADRGTYPIRDLLKRHGFKWSEDNKTWSCFLESGSISSPFECSQYLQRQAWIKDADGIVATFAWENQQHIIRIAKGRTTASDSVTSVSTIFNQDAYDIYRSEQMEWEYLSRFRPDYDYNDDSTEDDCEREMMHDELASDSENDARSNEEGWYYPEGDRE